MKTQSSILISLISIILFFGSCQKEKMNIEGKVVPQEFNINSIHLEVKDNMVEFNSKDEFYALFDNIEYETLKSNINEIAKNKNYLSYLEANPNFSKEESELIGNLVNSQGLIKIGAYFLLLDFENHTVYATKKLNQSDFLLQYKTNTSDVHKIPMDIETFEAIAELESQDVSRGGLFCRQRYARRKEKFGFSELAPGIWNGFSTSVQGRVKYLSYGIYYELQSAVVVHQNSISKAKYSYSTNYYCERRCSKKTFSGNNITKNYLTTLKKSTSNKMYWNPRALKGYEISCTVTSLQAVNNGTFSTLVQKVNSVSMNDW